MGTKQYCKKCKKWKRYENDLIGNTDVINVFFVICPKCNRKIFMYCGNKPKNFDDLDKIFN